MRKFLAPFVVTAAAALTLSGCGKTEAPPQMPAPQVSVATPLQQKVVDWDDFTGRVEAPERVEVRARASGFRVAIVLHTVASDWAKQQLSGIVGTLGNCGVAVIEVVDCAFTPEVQIEALDRLYRHLAGAVSGAP